jgi:hypothetical protein
MVIIHAAKAEKLGAADEVEDVRIVIELSSLLSRERMAEDASSIANALHDALPQGTWNRLVAEVAALWAKDTFGRISATEWYR